MVIGQSLATIKGPRGARGPRGFDGVNTVPTEAAIAQHTAPQALPLPAGFDWPGAPIELMWNRQGVVANFDVRTYRPTGGTTIFVDTVKGASGNTGLTPAQAKNNFISALAVASAGDTIEVLDQRVLWRPGNGIGTTTPVAKGVAIVPRHPGLKIPYADLLTYTKTSGRTSVYQTARSAVLKVVDVTESREGVTFTQAASVAECDALPGSWYTDGTILYVHALDSAAPDPWSVFALLDVGGFTFRSATTPVEAYVEGIDFYGGTRNMLLDRQDGGTLDFFAHQVGMFHAVGPTAGRNDNLVAAGARNVFLQECTVKHSNKDGANYASADFNNVTREAPHVIELNCDMGHNGLGQSSDLSCNASTGHTGSKIIRVGGTYQDTMGGVVCDVHADTQSVNVGIHASGSRTGLNEIRGSAISAGQGAESWVFGGEALDATVGIYSDTDSTVHHQAAWTFSVDGPGTINEL